MRIEPCDLGALFLQKNYKKNEIRNVGCKKKLSLSWREMLLVETKVLDV